MSINVGIIGLGVMGHNMLQAMREDGRFSVMAAYDLQPSPELNLEWASDVESLVKRADIDLVYIATPPKTHVQYASLALAEGKAVLCEKPLSVDLADSKMLVEQAKNLPNAVNFPFASKPMIGIMEKAIQSGEMGDLLSVDIRCQFPQWPRAWQKAGAWLSGREDGGFVREVVSHFVYLTERLVGNLELVAAMTTYADDEGAAESDIDADFLIGEIPVKLVGNVGQVEADHVEWILHGSKKSFRVLNWNFFFEGDGENWREIVFDAAEVRRLHMDEIAKLAEGKPHALADFAMGLRVQETIEGLLD